MGATLNPLNVSVCPMPTKPLRPCASQPCPELVTSGHCPTYAKEQDRDRRPEWVTKFYGSTRWKKLREWKRRHNPPREYCELDGLIVPATNVDSLTKPWLKRQGLGGCVLQGSVSFSCRGPQ